jgi:tetratricopeptide (TPR) repeat protein
VGQWDESIETNQRSIDVARRENSIGEALHASDYLEYAYLQEGRDSAALAVLDAVPALAARFDVNAITGAAPGSAGVFALVAIPARYALERKDWKRAASLQLPAHADQFPWTAAMFYFASGLGGAHTGNLLETGAAIDSLATIAVRLSRAGEAYWAQQVEIQLLALRAWMALGQKRTDSAVALLQRAAASEDSTEKSAVTPGPLAPARELLGDMFMEIGRPADALVAYRSTLEREPNRFRALYGAMRAARASGDRAAADRYASQLRTLTAKADKPGRAELSGVR